MDWFIRGILFLKEQGELTTLKIVMTVDIAFKEMFDNAWPKALQYFKEVCERWEQKL